MEILEELGYDVNDYATTIFNEIINETVDALNKYEKAQVKDLIYDKNSYIYVEIGYFCYEIGINRLYKELMRIHSERKSNSKIMSRKIFNNDLEPNLEDSILCIATYRNELDKEKENKIMIKN